MFVGDNELNKLQIINMVIIKMYCVIEGSSAGLSSKTTLGTCIASLTTDYKKENTGILGLEPIS